MSVAGMLDAMRSDRRPCERLVWACLENHANGRRFWSISIDDMAGELHLNSCTVVDATKALERDGVIRIRRTKRHTSTYFMLRTYDQEPGQKQCGNTELNSKVRSEIPNPTPDLTSEIPHVEADLSSEIPHVENPPRKNPPREDSSATFAKTEQQSGEPDLFPEQTVAPKPKASGRRKPVDADAAEARFAEFWQAFPRKKAKPRARASYLRRLREGVTPEELLHGLLAYRFHPDPTKQPHPATWLNDERWRDEPDRHYEPPGSMSYLAKMMAGEMPEFCE
jgi:hypothetical protein